VNPDQVIGLVLVPACGTIIPLAPASDISVAKALVRRVGAGTAVPAEPPPAEIEELRQRVGELEGRLDFGERLLAPARQRHGAGE